MQGEDKICQDLCPPEIIYGGNRPSLLPLCYVVMQHVKGDVDISVLTTSQWEFDSLNFVEQSGKATSNSDK